MREANPRLERAKWHSYLVDIERKKLLESIEEPNKENESILAIIWQAMDETISHYQQMVIYQIEVSLRIKVIRTKKH